jgi:hypothetical protein
MHEGKTNDLLIAFIGYVNDSNKLQQFKVGVQNPTTYFNALFNSLDNSNSSPEVVLAFLLYEGSTIHNESDQFVPCVYLFFVDFAFRPSPQTEIQRSKVCTRQLQTALFSQPLKIGHMFILTYLL